LFDSNVILHIVYVFQRLQIVGWSQYLGYET